MFEQNNYKSLYLEFTTEALKRDTECAYILYEYMERSSPFWGKESHGLWVKHAITS